MRDLSRDKSLLAINSATVKPWSLEQLIDGCVRAGITGIAPWRDIVQAAGVEKAGHMIRAAGLTVTCLCRGGLFPAADEAGRRAALADHRRAVAWFSLPVDCRRVRKISSVRRNRCATGSLHCCPMRSTAACRSPSSRCIRCMPPTAHA
jgi:hypothetical protein